ncbi:mttA/Hcf106 family protein [Paenibacillus sp. UNCCL117]|uniref:twin-arginine translocase TatA/TatE family subunit n=1 Tax=unclassified Paenibacillus TaxID=185978 RepID=UPI00088618CA|nr:MULTISPECIES: twin-arginine translocase TatA/TatE family subunit [unclassified Paenibacillus]SDD90982.1 mttA/Hcf106 family protein [Paenibacillus sp. cl123]SFW43798.1 mttA/Hcf106 family protein [Paenibacillus sp. UNCCL117]
MLGNIGTSEFILIAVVALIIFGPAKLPELGRSLGKTIREFKQGARDLLSDEPVKAERKDVTPPASSSAQTPEAAEGERQAAAASAQQAVETAAEQAVQEGTLAQSAQTPPASAANSAPETVAGSDAGDRLPEAAVPPVPDPVGGMTPLQDAPSSSGGGEAGRAARSNPRRLPD